MIPPLVLNIDYIDFLNIVASVSDKAQEYKQQLKDLGYFVTHPHYNEKQELPDSHINFKYEVMIFGSFQAFLNAVTLINYYSISCMQINFNSFKQPLSFQVTTEELLIIQTFEEKFCN